MAIDINRTPAEWKEIAERFAHLKDEMIALAKEHDVHISISASALHKAFYISVSNLAEQKYKGAETYMSYDTTTYEGEDKISKTLFEFGTD